MILSNLKIQEALDKGWLIIDPEPLPRQLTREGPECPYQTSAVDLRLRPEIAWLRPNMGLSMDLQEGGFQSLFDAGSERYDMSGGQPFRLEPGRFVHGKTLERVELPIPTNYNAPCFAARVEGRSSYARCGLLVHFTAPTIHAGYKGPITLEMMNFGPYPILLHAGSPICQLIIEQVNGIPFTRDSQFQEQFDNGERIS